MKNDIVITSGVTAIEAFAGSVSAADHWIKLAPRGLFTARDGRKFNVVPEVLVARFQVDGIHLPMDVDHATTKKTSAGESAPAVGWIERLEARADGLYGSVSWLKEGTRILADRTHRYISPAFQADDSGRAIWLHSAALVAAPAIAMPAVAAANVHEQDETVMSLKPLAAALDLPETADMTDVLSAILSLKNSAAAGDAAEQASNALQGITTELAAELKAAVAARHAAKVEDAIALGVVPPALRDWCLDLVKASEDRFDTFCANVGNPYAYLRQSAITPEQEEAARRLRGAAPVTLNSEAAKIARNLGIDVKTLT